MARFWPTRPWLPFGLHGPNWSLFGPKTLRHSREVPNDLLDIWITRHNGGVMALDVFFYQFFLSFTSLSQSCEALLGLEATPVLCWGKAPRWSFDFLFFCHPVCWRHCLRRFFLWEFYNSFGPGIWWLLWLDEILHTCERFGDLSFLGIEIIFEKKKSPLKNVCLSVLESRL